VRKIDDELHTCMRQLESLRMGVSLCEHIGFTMLGAYANTKVGANTYSVSVCGRAITVCADASLGLIEDERFQKIFEMKAFCDWLSNFDREFFEHCTFTRIYVQNIDFFGPRVGFLKFKTDIKYIVDNTALSSIVFMRGPAVAMLMVLKCDTEYYALTTVQPRVPIGKFSFCEIPAGMVDDASDFTGVAAKEIYEETGIKVNTSNLIDMLHVTGYSERGLYPSVGGCDEFLKFYLFTATVSRKGLDQLQGKLTGEIQEGEKICLKIVLLERLAFESPDMKTFTALYLYSRISSAVIRRQQVDLTTHDFSQPV